MSDELTEDEAVAALDAMNGTDQEGDHITADDILLRAASPAVRAAYVRCMERTGPWWFA